MTSPTCWLTRGMISNRTLAGRSIADAYTWHQMVWKAFPGRDGEPRDFLTRLDEKINGMQLLIVSPCRPERPEWLGEADAWESKLIGSDFFRPRRYRFQLRANPTVKRVVRDSTGTAKKNGRREAIRDETELQTWLQRKGEAGGFRLAEPASLETWAEPQPFEKKSVRKTGNRPVHNAVDFSGFIEISDPSLFFNHTFSKGIGSAKAFGFGLMVLSPA